MMNPKDGKSNDALDGITFAVDNGCFADDWKVEKWTAALARRQPIQDRCLFAVVPDVVADADATRVLWERWSPIVRAYGYKLAYVAQDGLSDVPWDELDVWFTGGSDAFKFSAEAHTAMQHAKRRGKWTHCGRVNSLKKLRAARDLGYDSADGTYVRFGPDVNLTKVLRWHDELHRQPPISVGESQ
jgi:hypothetical protein